MINKLNKLLVILIQIQHKKKQIDQRDFFCVFVCWFNLAAKLTGQPRQPVLTPSILDHKIHQRTTMRSSGRCGTGVNTLDHRCC